MQCTSRAGRRLFGRALVWGLLCALALVLQQAARPESAQAAKVTKGWLTGKILFNKHETRGIAEGGRRGRRSLRPLRSAAVRHRVPRGRGLDRAGRPRAQPRQVPPGQVRARPPRIPELSGHLFRRLLSLNDGGHSLRAASSDRAARCP